MSRVVGGGWRGSFFTHRLRDEDGIARLRNESAYRRADLPMDLNVCGRRA